MVTDADDRDRDPQGRARSARPRDGLGRPIAYGQQGVPTMPESLALTDEQTLTLAQELLDAGRPFHAHEVLESRWKAVERPAREVWQALAQVAVGLTHEARGNEEGAARLVRRGRDRLAATEPGCAPQVAVDRVVAWADAWLAGERGAPLRLAASAAGAT